MTNKLFEVDLATLEAQMLAQLGIAIKDLCNAANFYDRVLAQPAYDRDAAGTDHIEWLISAAQNLRDAVEDKKISR